MGTIIMFAIKIALTIGLYRFDWADETVLETILTYLAIYGVSSLLVNLVATLGIFRTFLVILGTIAATDYLITNETAQLIITISVIVINIIFDIYVLTAFVKDAWAFISGNDID